MPRRMNWAAWQPDLRDFHEDEFHGNQYRVFRTMRARRRLGSTVFFCEQCSGLIGPDEEYDAMGVSGAGVSGYLHPRRLHLACRAGYIEKWNRQKAEQFGIIISICGRCGKYMGYQDGQGSHGLSGTYCETCFKDWTAERTDPGIVEC